MRFSRTRPAMLLVMLCLSLAVVRAQQAGAQAPAAPAGPLAPEKYKDIKVLTDLPADQLDVTMRYFVAATGLQCQNCHQRDQADGTFTYEADTRTKTTARSMINLVKTVNAGNFGARINCGTCHAGRNQPAGLQLAQMMTPDQIAQAAAQQAAIAARQGGGGAPGGAPGGGRGQQPALPAVDDIINKYADALGGAAALAKIQSRTMTGTVTHRDTQSGPFTLEEKGAEMLLPAQIKARYPNLAAARVAAIPSATPGGTPTQTVGLRGNTAPNVTETLTFDAGTGLLLRRSVRTTTGLNGSLNEQFDYSDYRVVNGVKMPFEIKHANWNTLDTMKVTDIKVNATIPGAHSATPR